MLCLRSNGSDGPSDYKIEPVITALFGFTGHPVSPTRMINMPLSLGEESTRKTRIIKFVIVKALPSYNLIFGLPSMTIFMVMAFALHKKIKFPVGTVVG